MNPDIGQDSDDEANQRPFEVSSADLSESVLNEVIANFIQPEGAEFGMTESALQAKERVVRKQIETGSLKLISDPGSESVTLMSSQDWRNLIAKMK
jgi:uncharacterized protein YheU (UPF0270 family)